MIGPETVLSSDIIPAGFPFIGKEIWTVDEENNRLETGQAGRIAVRSRYLADGYWHARENAKHFIQDSMDPKKRIFFSNDLGLIRQDGMLEFFGREDEMEKIRGFRVERGAIEAAILDAGVQETAVVVQIDADGEKHLVAYLVQAGENQREPEKLRSNLARKLPEYMLPEIFVTLERLPFLAAGKIDRLSLPNPYLTKGKEPADRPGRSIESDPIETQVSEIVDSILKLDGIGLEENLFVCGCNSLLAARIIARINDGFNLELPIREIYSFPSIAKLTEIIQVNLNQKPSSGDKPELSADTIEYLRQFG